MTSIELKKYFTNLLKECNEDLTYIEFINESEYIPKYLIITLTNYIKIEKSDKKFIIIITENVSNFQIPISENIICYIFLNNKTLYSSTEYLPKESKISIETSYFSQNNSSIQNRLENHFLLLLSDEPYEYLLLQRICSFFNKNHDKYLVICANENVIEKYCLEINPNISYEKIENKSTLIIKSTYILCNRHNCYDSILSNRPTIVLGQHGLGGIVYPHNYQFFETSDFKGRPGGDINEIIPENLLDYEISYYQQFPNKEKMLEDLKKLVTTVLTKRNTNLYNFIVNKVKTDLKSHDLKHKFSEGIVCSYNNTIRKWMIINRYTNKIKYAFPDNYKHFIQQLNFGIYYNNLKSIDPQGTLELQNLYDILKAEKIIIPIYE